MSKDSGIDDLLKAGAIIGGIGLVIGLIKLMSERRYRCPVCKNEISHEANPCPKCGTPLTWSQ